MGGPVGQACCHFVWSRPACDAAARRLLGNSFERDFSSAPLESVPAFLAVTGWAEDAATAEGEEFDFAASSVGFQSDPHAIDRLRAVGLPIPR
jgi:hypothetical protein